ncbi:MAG: LysR family transcriptional regulator [Ramlibacter sp.]|jgi:DNA-binding transcriptional LysR family regulator|nr:LysR family transcriptional regulator [Ramlibacter sp.]
MLDALTLGQLRTFVAIAEAGGFRAGAAQLRRAQSAVSHAVAGLESELGIALFDRSGHRPVLTPAGAALLEDARGVLLKVDTLRARAQGLGMGLELELPLVLDVLFPLDTACAALRAVHERYPSVRVELHVAPLGGPPAALLDGRSVLAITAGEDLHDPRLAKEPLATISVVPVVAAVHPIGVLIRSPARLRLETVAEHLQVVLQDPTSMSAGRDFNVLSPRTWRVGTQEAKQALIEAGVGWGRLPLWCVEGALRQGSLLRIPSRALGQAREAPVQTYIAHRRDRVLGPAASVLREELLRRST